MGLSLVSEIGARTSPGRILAIDYGRRRLGLAVSDPLRMTARPLATWIRSNRRRDLARLRRLCREEEVKLIVVGWPLQLGGSQGEMAAEARQFADLIRDYLGIAVELVDERLSSWEAEQAITAVAQGKRRSGKRKQHKLDEVAAAVILRDYLRSSGGAA